MFTPSSMGEVGDTAKNAYFGHSAGSLGEITVPECRCILGGLEIVRAQAFGDESLSSSGIRWGLPTGFWLPSPFNEFCRV